MLKINDLKVTNKKEFILGDTLYRVNCEVLQEYIYDANIGKYAWESSSLSLKDVLFYLQDIQKQMIELRPTVRCLKLLSSLNKKSYIVKDYDGDVKLFSYAPIMNKEENKWVKGTDDDNPITINNFVNYKVDFEWLQCDATPKTINYYLNKYQIPVFKRA